MSLIDKIAKGGPGGIYTEHVIPSNVGPIAPAKPFAEVGVSGLLRTRGIPEPHLYYVYVWYDPRNGSPIYVGKGTEKGKREPYAFKRAHRTHISNPLLAKVLRAVRRDGYKHEVRIHYCFIEECAAFEEEVKLIAEFGRRDLGTGTLCNLTEGGEGAPELGPKALKRLTDTTTKQWKDPKFRKARVQSIRDSWNDPDKRARNADAMRKLAADPAQRKIRSDNAKARWADPEFKKRVSRKTSRTRAASGGNDSIGEKSRLRWADPAYKARATEAVRKSINDKFANDPAYRAACKRGGQKNKKLFKDPAHRLKHSQATKAGMRKAGY